MIKFESISFRNFLSTGNQPTVIKLDAAVTSIMTGSNGGGKSTFEDAIVYNLFGKPFRKIKLGQLINDVNQKELVTECNFTIGSKRYKIIRGQKPAVFEIWVDGIIIPQPAETKDYQHILENDILKLNYKTFTQIIILGSASFVPFMQLPLGTRREIIENILDISVFSDMNDILKDKVKDLDKELINLSHSFDLLNNNYKLKYDFFQKRTSDNVERIKDLNAKIENYKEQSYSQAEKKRLLDDDIETLKKVIDSYGDLETKKDTATKRLSSLEREISDTTYKLKGINDNTEKKVVLQKSIEETEDELSIARGELDTLNAAITILSTALRAFDDIDSKKSAAEKIVILATQSIRDKENKIRFYNDNNDCPTCGKHIDTDDDFESGLIESYESDIKIAKTNIKTVNEVILNMKAKQKERMDFQNALNKHEKNSTALVQKIQMLERTLSNHNKNLNEIIIPSVEELEIVTGALDKKKIEVTLIEQEVELFKKQYGELCEVKESLNNTISQSKLCSQLITGYRVQMKDYSDDIEKIQNEAPSDITQEVLDALIVEIKNTDETIIKRKHMAHYYGIVKRLLKDDGIKTNIISQYLPIINATVNMYLDKMDFPINFEFDNNFNESIQSKYRGDFSYHSFSEGEKARIDLALLFTWRDITLKKSRNATNILIFDEIFDGSLDSGGIENFMDILGLNKSDCSTFIISHKDATINSRFDRNLVFTKDGYFSIMEEING